MELSPIVLFVYNRPDHTRRTLEALRGNDLAGQSRLFIFSDGPKGEDDAACVAEVSDIIGGVSGFASVEIVERECNYGLAESIIAGVTEIVERFGRVIVLEDDLITAPGFLRFMNDALAFYEQDERIFSVTGVHFPIALPDGYPRRIYLSHRASSWGWGTWDDKWNKADWDVRDFDDFARDRKAQTLFNRGGEDLTDMLLAQQRGLTDSWAIRWCYTHFRNGAFCLYPTTSLLMNIGYDGTGVHCSTGDKYVKPLPTGDIGSIGMAKGIDIHPEITRNLERFYRRSWPKRLVRSIKRRFE